MSEDADAVSDARPEVAASRRRSRRFAFFIPRFGTAWLFVGMLLLISAAGWWKFHRDLYVEEVEAIRALKEAAGSVSAVRGEPAFAWMAVADEADDEIPWNAALLPPVERIYVEGDAAADVRGDVARLPRLKALSFEIDRSGETSRTAKAEPFNLEKGLGRALPPFPEPTLSEASLVEPLPSGDDVDEAEASRIADAIYDAWRREDATPDRFVAASRSVPLDKVHKSYGPQVVVHLVEPDRRYHYYAYERDGAAERAVYLVDDVRYDFRRIAGAWRRESREVDAGLQEDDEVFRRFPHDDYPYLGANFHGWLIVSRALQSMPMYEFRRVAKIDDVRYRVDFKPFVATADEEERRSHEIDPQVTEWSLVVRSDLDWAAEESLIAQSIQYRQPAGQTAKPERYERRMAQRHVRDDDHVVLQERIVREGFGPADSLYLQELTHHVYAREVDPEYDQSIFDPLSLDPEPWPDRRELPWLPWHRVTFLLGCGLTVMLIGRRFMPKRSKAETPDELRETDAEATTTT